MFGGQFFPYQPIQFMDGLLTPTIGVGVAAATVAAAGLLSSDSNATIYTSGSISIGTPGSDRFIIVVAGGNSASLRTGSACTVDGVSLSFVVGQSNSLSRLEIWAGYVNTANSTGVLEFTWSGGQSRARFQLVECHNIISATAEAIDSDTTDATAVTGSVSAGGVAVSGAWSQAITTFGWTGDGSDYGDVAGGESGSLSAAGAAYASAGTASMTPDAASASQFCSVMATFR